MSLFSPRQQKDVKELVEAYPLCWIVSDSTGERHATPLPLLPEQGADGEVQSLFGHIAFSNPQQKALEKDARATILCMGPQSYISPRLVSNPTWGPTWNYAVCRFETEVQFVPDETDIALSKLAEALEGTAPGAWNPGFMGERYHQLRTHIVAFRARVLETHARFKLGQDENETVFSEIVEKLSDRTLSNWMSRSRA